MKRFEPISNKHIEVLLTEAAYEALTDEDFELKTTIRLKSNYKSLDGVWDKVYLMRLESEKNADCLKYHPTSYYECRKEFRHLHHR